MYRSWLIVVCLWLSGLSFYSCKTDVDELWDSIHKLDDRVTSLEELCKQINGNISALQVLVEAEKSKVGITKVEPLIQNNQTIGYTIYFSEGDPITIYHGKDGENGKDGKPGSSSDIPQIGVKLDKDGNYYWTIDGSWLTDDDGNKIRANGLDGEPGKDGQPGADGKPGQDGQNGQNGTDGANGTNGRDGITPQLKIENGRWLVSVDQGSTWTDVGPATAESGDLIFQEVDFSDTNFVKFTLTDGTVLELVTKYAYETLKSGVDQLNTEIGTLRQLITALQNRDYITNVIAVYKNDQEIGYKITFASGTDITIRHGEKGEQGAQGAQGPQGPQGEAGQPGQPGQNGSTPIVGVKQDTDNIYYWTLNGEWLLDNNGQKVRAQGLDGQNGTDGQPGAPGTDGQNGRDGVTPQLKIENGYWYVSTDNGQNWTQLGRATGENGQDGQNGADGQDGADGESLFSNVDVSNNEFVKFVLTDGTEIKLPTYAAFVALKEQVDQLNQQISSLQTLVEAVQQGDYITSVDRVYEGGIEIGYKISFANRAAIVVRHGEKGEQGAQGEQGIQGPQGEPGQNGSTPIIGVKQDTDNIYYWTLNGEWLLDSNGQKVRAQGLDGQNGTDGQPGASGLDGQNGRDGVTPQLRIQDGYWEVSTDNGQTWTRLGKATGENGQDGADGESLFSDITVTEDYVTLILRGSGETIELPTKHVFEQLQQQVNTLNTNISALQIIVNALEAKTFITNVVEVSDASNQTIGYKVVLSDNTTFTIYHGRDGTDGDTPHIGVTEIAGVYYWTVDGFLLQDSHGNSIKVTGEDGEDGITPKLKIEDGRWYISYDYGASWRDIGQATGEQGPAGPSGSGNCLFKEVEIDQPTGTFIVTLFDDSRFGLPMYTYFKLVFDISEHAPAVYRKAPGKSFDVMFRFEPFSSNGTSTSADVQISVIGGSKNTVNYDSRGFGTIHLTASYEEKEEQIMVFVKTKAYTTWETFTVITDYDYAEIGDIYYSNHKPEGIVWKKKEGSQKGCMLSCLQYEYGWTGSPATCTWITDTYGYNSGWAYPTIDQLESCIQSITTAGWSDVNEKLVSLGYEEIPHILLSSTYDEVNNRLNLITYDPPMQAVVLRINLEAAGLVYPIRAIKEF